VVGGGLPEQEEDQVTEFSIGRERNVGINLNVDYSSKYGFF
jgi:hypothetical protein